MPQEIGIILYMSERENVDESHGETMKDDFIKYFLNLCLGAVTTITLVLIHRGIMLIHSLARSLPVEELVLTVG